MSTIHARKAYRLKGRPGLFVDVTTAADQTDNVSIEVENTLVGYLLTPAEYQRILAIYEDQELNALADARQRQERVRVAFDDL